MRSWQWYNYYLQVRFILTILYNSAHSCITIARSRYLQVQFLCAVDLQQEFYSLPVLQLGLAPIFEMTLPHHAMVVELDSAGEVVRSLHDRGGQVTSSVSHVLDQTDRLLMGSYHAPYLVLLNVSDLPHQ